MAKFADLDPIEDMMGKRVEDMNPDQLVTYLKIHQEAYFSITMPIDGLKERSVMRGMIRHYGQPDAGRLVKWVTYKYNGRYKGEIVGFFSFASGRRWWTDIMHREMQLRVAAELVEESSEETVGSGWRTDL